jgi:hypothetical protein
MSSIGYSDSDLDNTKSTKYFKLLISGLVNCPSQSFKGNKKIEIVLNCVWQQ